MPEHTRAQHSPAEAVEAQRSEVEPTGSSRAAEAHQSLQEYLLGGLMDEASLPTLDEVLDRAGSRVGGAVTFAEASDLIQSDPDRR